MSGIKIDNENDTEEVENSLKEFIDKMVKFYEVYRIEEFHIKNYEKQLNNSETLLEVFEIIKNMFETWMNNIFKHNDEYWDCSNISVNNKEKKNKNIEQIWYNYEKEINKHIKNELKLKDIINNNEIQIKNLNKNLQETKLNLRKIKLENKNLKLNTKSEMKSSFNFTKNLKKINEQKNNKFVKKILNKSLQKININSLICKEKTVNIKKIQNLINPKTKSRTKLNIKNFKSFNKNI